MAELKQQTQEVTDIIGKNLTVDGKSKEVKLAETTFDDILKHFEVSKDTYNKVKEVDSHTAAGLLNALGTASIPAMKKNKDIESLDVTLPTTGRDFFKASIDRTTTNRNPQTKEEVISYGAGNVSHHVNGTRKGPVAVVKGLLKAQAAQELGK